ncbi:MAG: molybdopterin-dependent oxidoreductase [Nitrososphaerales archaeon]
MGSHKISRRLFIKSGANAAVGAAMVVYGVGLLGRDPLRAPPVPFNPLDSREVTPNEEFYTVDIDVVPPSLSATGWTLTVSGLVSDPLSLTLDQIQQMPTIDLYTTLECVGNAVGGDLIGTAQWSGVRLRDVLAAAGLQSDAEYIIFTCADGYTAAIPTETALLDGTLLALGMNDAVLPPEHGYPLRAIVQGLYGEMNAKWITGIQAVSAEYLGYYALAGWTNDAPYQTGSSIATPGSAPVADVFGILGSSSVPLGRVPIAGMAFAGDRGISKVEVSADGGATWSPASMKDPLSDYTWVLWSAYWNPPSTGGYALVVRATDGQGNAQTATITTPFPAGATGYHTVDVTVVQSESG